MVGRGHESQALSDFRHGPAPALELVGAVGSGRSQLLTLLDAGSGSRRWSIVRLGPDPDLVPTPWYPVRCALAGVLGLESLSPRAAGLERAGKAAGLSGPELRALADLFQVQRPRGDQDPATRRQAIRGLALGLLRADRAPRLIVADDVDDYDAGSRDLVRELAEVADGDALKVAVSSRRPFLDPGTAPVTLAVGPLSAEGVTSLCAVVKRFRTDLPADLPLRVQEASAGNVLHVLQLLRLLHEGGTVRPGPLPDVLVERMGLLPPAARRALQGLAVLGLVTTTARLAALDGGTPVPDEALEVLARRGFVHRAPDGALFITHPLVAETIRESIPAEVRRRYHAAAMSRTEPVDDRIIEHALHAERAGLGEPALHSLRRAAAWAEERLDDDLAADLLRRALNLTRWELLLDEDDPTCTGLEVDLGVALSRTSDVQGARAVLKVALARPGLANDDRARALRALAAV
jgi:hypothetical protein